MKKLYSLLFLFALSTSGFAQYIYTVAGISGGPSGGLATCSQLGYLDNKVIFDAVGNMYIPDQTYNKIWKVDTNGVMTTFAGTGATGYNGDSIPATDATLYDPAGLAFDTNGNLIVADYSNRRIRKIDISTGLIYTIAGNGNYGYDGDSIPATSTAMMDVYSIAIDNANNIYINDISYIRKIDGSTGLIYTIAGTGISGYNGDNIPASGAQLNLPREITLDAAGNLYIADEGNNRVRKIDNTTGTISTVAGNGGTGFNGDNIAATSATLYHPYSVCFDTSGCLLIADQWNKRIRKVSSLGIITTVAGGAAAPFSYDGDGGPALAAYIVAPEGVSVDHHNRIFITDQSKIRMVTNYIDTDDVWPGDTDNDNIVDNNDLLPIGIYFYRMGPLRGSTSNVWQAWSAPSWWANQATGNLKHIDCNGNGEIAMTDTIAVHNNFNSTHAFIMPPDNGTRTVDPDIYFIPDNTSYTAGSLVTAELWIGTASTPVVDLYGISFDIGYNNSFVQPGTTSVSYPTGFFGTPGNECLRFSKTNAVPDVAFGALVRKTGTAVNGFGKLADVSFIVNSNIDHVDSLHLSVLAYRAIDIGSVPKDLNIVPLGTWNGVGISSAGKTSEIGVYPNPSAGMFTLRYPSSANGQKKIVSIYNTLGKKINSFEDATDNTSIDLSNQAPGVYILSVETNGQVFKSRIIKE